MTNNTQYNRTRDNKIGLGAVHAAAVILGGQFRKVLDKNLRYYLIIR